MTEAPFDEAHLQSLVSSLGKKESDASGQKSYVRDPECHGESRIAPSFFFPRLISKQRQNSQKKRHLKKKKIISYTTTETDLRVLPHPPHAAAPLLATYRDAARPSAVPPKGHDPRTTRDDAASRVELGGEGPAAPLDDLPHRD